MISQQSISAGFFFFSVCFISGSSFADQVASNPYAKEVFRAGDTTFASIGDGENAFSRGDYDEALREWRPLAEQGDAHAQSWLCAMYIFGFGVARDHAEALKWCRLSAEQGNASGQSNQGYLYADGLGVPRDYSKSMKWFGAAAEQGFALAQLNLGTLYEFGRGVSVDYAKALHWYLMQRLCACRS